MPAPWKESYGKPRQYIKKQRHHFANKGPYSQSYSFSSSQVPMRVESQRKLSTKELMFSNCGTGEDSFESSLDSKEIKPINPKGNQPWILIGRTDAEAEAPILWPSDAKNQLFGKDTFAWKDWRQEEGTTEDEMVGWHHQLNGHEFGWTPGVGDGQGGLVCCNSWGRRVGHNWATELKIEDHINHLSNVQTKIWVKWWH